jgi:hypothetical protein
MNYIISIIYVILTVVFVIQLGTIKKSTDLKRTFGAMVATLLLLLGLSIYFVTCGATTFLVTVALLAVILANVGNLYIMAREGQVINSNCINALAFISGLYIAVTSGLLIAESVSRRGIAGNRTSMSVLTGRR